MSTNSTDANMKVRTTGHVQYFSQLHGSLCGNETLLCDGTGHNFVITAGSIEGQDPVSKTYIARGCGRELLESTPDITAPAERTFTISAFRECGGISELMYAPQCESVFYEAIGCNPPEEFDMITVFHGSNPRDIEPTAGSLTDVNTKLTDSKTYLQVCSYVIARLQYSETVEFNIPVVDEVYFGGASCQAGDGCGCSTNSAHGYENIAKLLDAGFDADWPILAFSNDGGNTFTQSILDIDALVAGSTIAAADVQAVALEETANGLVVVLQGVDGYVYVPYTGLTSCPSGGCDTTPVFISATGIGNATDVTVTGRTVVWSGLAGQIWQSQQITLGNVEQVATGISTSDFTRVDSNGSTVVAVGTSDNGIVYTNNLVTWQAATNPPGFPGYAITSVAVKSANTWEIITDTGLAFRTCDAGCTWSQFLTFAGPGDDIMYATDQVGYIVSTDISGAVEVLYTWNGGADWLRGNCNSRGADFAPCTRGAYGNLSGHHGYRLAVPKSGNLFTRANHLLLGGGTAAGTGCQHIATPKYTSGK